MVKNHESFVYIFTLSEKFFKFIEVVFQAIKFTTSDFIVL